MLRKTPRGMRLHIAIFGRRNVGKSSLLNAITRQKVSIVSEKAGTTTDPVEKPMELLPLGPVVFIDTAGLDDIGDLGQLRIAKTEKVFERAEIALLVCDGNNFGKKEEEIIKKIIAKNIALIIVLNKIDLTAPSAELLAELTSSYGDKAKIAQTSTVSGKGLAELRQTLIDLAPEDYINQPAIIRDLVSAGETAVLVVPIDKEAPKGRIILPQVQAIRDLLDGDSAALVVKEGQLKETLKNLKNPPRLVVTDSQAFKKVSAATPEDILMTGFSILFARFKGDLTSMTANTLAVDNLQPGDNILVAESCTHHPIEEDIGRVKIPQWLNEYVGGKLNFTTTQGHDFPTEAEELKKYKLVIHCGSCMWNRREMISRIQGCHQANVPITNYGLVIAYSLGIFARALKPFPAALEAYNLAKKNKD